MTRLALVLLTLCSLGCATTSAMVLQREYEEAYPPPGWAPEARLRHCEATGERLTLRDGRQVYVLACPDGRYVAADTVSGRRVR